MSDGTVQIDRGQFVAQRGAFGDALAAELGARLSRAFGFTPANPQDVGVLELAESDEPLVHQRFGYAQGEGGFHAVLSKRDAALLAALEQRAEGDAIEAARSADFDEDKLGAFKQVMASVADVLKRSFEGSGMPELAVGDAAVASSPQSDPTWIADAFYVRFRFAMSVEGFESASFDLIVATGDLVGDAPHLLAGWAWRLSLVGAAILAVVAVIACWPGAPAPAEGDPLPWWAWLGRTGIHLLPLAMLALVGVGQVGH